MYTIYHIPNVKIGCTKREVSKRVKEQSYTHYEILEVHNDIQIAAQREIELQTEYGYRVDKGSTAYSDSFSKKGTIGAKKSAVTQKKLKVGFYTKDSNKRIERAKSGANAVLKKYGSEHFKKMRANSNCVEKAKEVCNKSIIRIDKIGNIKHYNSISDAANDLDVSVTAISNCLCGKVKTSCGYKWEYQK